MGSGFNAGLLLLLLPSLLHLAKPDELGDMLQTCQAHMGRGIFRSNGKVDAEGLALRKCMIREAREALRCDPSGGTEEEEACVGSAEAGMTKTRNKGWPGGMSFLTPLPTFMDIACQGAFPVTCNSSAPFRSITGICNNLDHQLWGAASTKVRRYIGAAYADGNDVPRGGWESSFNHCVTGTIGRGERHQRRNPAGANRHQSSCKGSPSAILPNPRFVSYTMIGDDRAATDPEATHLFVQFGQYVCHDIALFPEEETERDCCDVPDQDGCFPIQVPCEDPHFLKPEFKPRRVKRSFPVVNLVNEAGTEPEIWQARVKRDTGTLYAGAGLVTAEMRQRWRNERRKKRLRQRRQRFDPDRLARGRRRRARVGAGRHPTVPLGMQLPPPQPLQQQQQQPWDFGGQQQATAYRQDVGGSKTSARFDPRSGKRDAPLTIGMARAKAAGLLPEGARGLAAGMPPSPGGPERRGFMDPEYCLEFRRSIAFCEERTVKRDQLNGNTAFLDNSNIYGNEFSVFKKLRLYKGGRMKTSQGGLNLPLQESRCVSGDPRAAEMPSLASFHTLFVREHNRVAGLLEKTCCDGDDDKVFQRARRIVIAEFQNVVFSQFLPQLFGPGILETYRLGVGGRSRYDPSVNPTIRNAFSTAAFRFGHSMIWNNVTLVDGGGRPIREYQIRDTYFDDSVPLSAGGRGVDHVLNGMARQPGGRVDLSVVEDVTNFLFVNGSGVTGADLVARNVQRGRDHGLPPYNEYRRYCGMAPACRWDQRPPELSREAWRTLEGLYDSPRDIDLYVGGLAEEAGRAESMLGRTFTCLVAKQFYNLKFGDRFFYTHAAGPGVVYPFTDEQLANLRARTIRDLVCDNTDLPSFPDDPFRMSSKSRSCSKKVPLKISLFSDSYEKQALFAKGR